MISNFLILPYGESCGKEPLSSQQEATLLLACSLSYHCELLSSTRSWLTGQVLQCINNECYVNMLSFVGYGNYMWSCPDG